MWKSKSAQFLCWHTSLDGTCKSTTEILCVANANPIFSFIHTYFSLGNRRWRRLRSSGGYLVTSHHSVGVGLWSRPKFKVLTNESINIHIAWCATHTRSSTMQPWIQCYVCPIHSIVSQQRPTITPHSFWIDEASIRHQSPTARIFDSQRIHVQYHGATGPLKRR